MALIDVREQIRLETGGRTDIDSIIDDQVNFALQEFSTMYEFDELWGDATTTTNANQFAYLLPSDLYVLWTVKEETRLNRELEQKEYRAFHNQDETNTGIPHYFAQYNRKLILFNQVPDSNAGSNYTIRILYWKKHPTLATDNEAMILPAEWERGVRLKATAFVFTILDQDEKAAAKMQEVDRWMQRVRLPQGMRKEKVKYARVNPMIFRA